MGDIGVLTGEIRELVGGQKNELQKKAVLHPDVLGSMKEASQIAGSLSQKVAENPPHLSLEDLTTTLDRLTNIKHLTDQIDSVESKL